MIMLERNPTYLSKICLFHGHLKKTSRIQFKNPYQNDYHFLLVIIFVFDIDHSNALLVPFTAIHVKKLMFIIYFDVNVW